MSVIKRRSRIVSFRLSEEEFAAMKERCISEGARSISDFARTSACRPFNGDALRQMMANEDTLQRLRQRVEDLDFEVRRLVRSLDSARAVESEALAMEAAHDPASFRRTPRQERKVQS